MPDLPHDADADVISAGREPRARPLRPGRLVRLVLIAESVLLAGSVAVALHYRSEVSRLRHRGPAASQAGPLPQMTSLTVRLPPDGTIAGTVLITAAAQPGARRGQFAVSATITGGHPGTVYDLTGNDCSAVAPLPDHVWATGVTDAAGTAQLTGHAWTGLITDAYWLALSPSPVRPPRACGDRSSRGQRPGSPPARPPADCPEAGAVSHAKLTA